MTILCARCRETKPAEQFGSSVRPNGRVRLLAYCKPCMTEYHRAWRQGVGREKFYAGLDRSRSNTTNRARIRAGEKARKAIRDGRLVREPCEVGGDCSGDIHAHHDDYSKPLAVRWLCRRHHALADVDRRRSEAVEAATYLATSTEAHGL